MNRTLAALMLALSAGPAFSGSAQAQAHLSGTWQYQATQEEIAGRAASIRAATEALPAFARDHARARLNARTAPAPQLSISIVGSQLTLVRPERHVSLSIGGDAVEVEGDHGRGEVRADRQVGDLRVVMRGERGSLTAVYRLSDDGRRLVVSVRISAGPLASPVVFQATYHRADA
ncbi:MAG: hypothetical protein AAF411_29655 [Myxococcota bacterium]